MTTTSSFANLMDGVGTQSFMLGNPVPDTIFPTDGCSISWSFLCRLLGGLTFLKTRLRELKYLTAFFGRIYKLASEIMPLPSFALLHLFWRAMVRFRSAFGVFLAIFLHSFVIN